MSRIDSSGSSALPPRQPKNGIIWGSKDGVTWTQLKTFSSLYGTVSAVTDPYRINVNANDYYKYLNFQVTATQTHLPSGAAHSNFNAVALIGLKYYGHQEDDLTRFPEPTKTLKYPHITWEKGAGPVKRGHAVTVSSYYNSGVKPEHVFSNDWVSQGNSWQSGPVGNYATSGVGRYTAGSTFNTAYLSNTPLYGEGGFQTTESSNT